MQKRHQGFTLIELLVVIAILGILASIGLVSFPAAQKQARDTARKSDLKQYQTALEGFANKSANGFYPARTTAVKPATLCGVNLLEIGNNCPQDPKTGTATYEYQYLSDGTNPNNNALNFILWAHLERTDNYFIICSDGRAGTQATAPTALPCPL
jgi:prepilin-type N-terminal cleavage/methylation domain-containing protein